MEHVLVLQMIVFCLRSAFSWMTIMICGYTITIKLLNRMIYPHPNTCHMSLNRLLDIFFVLFSQMYMYFMYWTDLFELLHFSFAFMRLSLNIHDGSTTKHVHDFPLPYMDSAFSSPHDGSWTWQSIQTGYVVNTWLLNSCSRFFKLFGIFRRMREWICTKWDCTLSHFGFFPSFHPLPENIQWHTERSILVSPNSKKTMGFWKFLTVTRWRGVDFSYFPFAFQRGTFGTACMNNIDRFLHHAMRWPVHHLSHKRSVVFLGRSEQREECLRGRNKKRQPDGG